MIIIEGAKGKSVVLENYLNNIETEDIAVLDSVGLHGLKVKDGVNHYFLKGESDDKLIAYVEDYYDSKFIEYEWIIFSVNTKKIVKFIELEKKFPDKKFVVTVQNNNLDQVSIRDTSSMNVNVKYVIKTDEGYYCKTNVTGSMFGMAAGIVTSIQDATIYEFSKDDSVEDLEKGVIVKWLYSDVVKDGGTSPKLIRVKLSEV